MRFVAGLELIIFLSILGCSEGHQAERRVFQDKYVRALANAAAIGDTNAIDHALGLGASPNYEGKDGVTPLVWAMRGNNKIGYEYLLRKGGNPNWRNSPGNTLLSEAVYREDPFYLEAALKFGGDPNQRIMTSIGKICLLEYVTSLTRARPDLVRILIEHGADVHLCNQYIVSGCAMQNDYENAYLLLQAGASFSTNNTRYKLVWLIGNRSIDPAHSDYAWRSKVVSFLHGQGVEVTPKN